MAGRTPYQARPGKLRIEGEISLGNEKPQQAADAFAAWLDDHHFTFHGKIVTTYQIVGGPSPAST